MDGRLFWFVIGIASYWALQHFTGIGNTGRGATS
jgi:hypothetical protein